MDVVIQDHAWPERHVLPPVITRMRMGAEVAFKMGSVRHAVES